MYFTLGYKKNGNSNWKGPSTQNVFPSNSRPIKNTDPELISLTGPYPSSKPPSAPVTTTKIGILTHDFQGNPYKTVTFGLITCTNVGTSLPICYKKLPRPVKVWRKRLFPDFKSESKLKPTISQIENPGTVVQSICQGNSHVLYTDINHLSTCDGVRTETQCVGGTNHIRRSSSTILDKNYCTTTREYLQKRCKSFDQNQSVGKNISGTAYNSGMGFEAGNVTGNCNVIQYKPSNNRFKVQGGVTSSSRTSLLKSQAINQSKQNVYKNPILKKDIQCFKVSQDRVLTICK
jgi:hypothetical protein